MVARHAARGPTGLGPAALTVALPCRAHPLQGVQLGTVIGRRVLLARWRLLLRVLQVLLLLFCLVGVVLRLVSQLLGEAGQPFLLLLLLDVHLRGLWLRVRLPRLLLLRGWKLWGQRKLMPCVLCLVWTRGEGDPSLLEAPDLAS